MYTPTTYAHSRQDRHSRARIAGLVAVVAIVLAAAEARATPVDTDRLELELSDYERLPTRAQLRASHGPDVARALREIARQGKRALARNRALTLLRLFPSRRTSKLLLQTIELNRHARKGLPILDLKQALVSYAVVAGPRALGLIARFIHHDSIGVRCSAAAAAQLTRNPQAAALLRARLETERSSTVRAEIRGELAKLTKKPAAP